MTKKNAMGEFFPQLLKLLRNRQRATFRATLPNVILGRVEVPRIPASEEAVQVSSVSRTREILEVSENPRAEEISEAFENAQTQEMPENVGNRVFQVAPRAPILPKSSKLSEAPQVHEPQQ